MHFTGFKYPEFEEIVKLTSRMHYDNNVIIDRWADLGGVRRPKFRATLRTETGKDPNDKDRCAPGSRRGPENFEGKRGKRMPYVCWHAVRDVLGACFERYPDAVVRTRIAIYRGREGFLEEFPKTGEINVGSQVNWQYLPDLCACSESKPGQPDDEPLYVPGPFIIREELDIEDFLAAC